MTSKCLLVLSALLATACTSATPPSSGAPASTSNVTAEKIETCWKQVGFKGDLYKFMTPAEAQGLNKVEGASDAQVSQFKACIAA